MRKLPIPKRSAQFVYDACVATVRNPGHKAKLKATAALVTPAEIDYTNKAQLASLHQVLPSQVLGTVSSDEMQSLYDNSLVRSTSPSRYIYDEIRGASGICPLCQQRDVGSIDHYLPQCDFAALTVMPVNLVPACSSCNKIKLSYVSSSQSDQLLHPYFDFVDDEIWLFAEVKISEPPLVRFVCRPHETWTEIKKARMTVHFDTLKLASLYASHGVGELLNASSACKIYLRRGGLSRLREEMLIREETYRENGKNTWQAAFYAALAASEWFCTVGYALVRPD